MGKAQNLNASLPAGAQVFAMADRRLRCPSIEKSIHELPKLRVAPLPTLGPTVFANTEFNS
jgi:hypothetical protein